MDRPEIILAPGPTPIPPEVLLAQGSPLVYHRGPGFGDLMREVTDAAAGAIRTDVADVLAVDVVAGPAASSPRSQNLLSPGDEVLVPLAGFFSRAVASASPPPTGSRCTRWSTSGARRSTRRRRRARWPSTRVKAVLLTQSETSTGVIQPVEELAAVARRRRRAGGGRRGVEPRRGAVRVRRLGGRRRRRRAPRRPCRRAPGIAFVAVSERAWEAARDRDEPALLLRLGGLQAVRGRCRTPRTRGRRRSA